MLREPVGLTELAREAALEKRLQAVPAKPGVAFHLPGLGGKIRPREGLNPFRLTPPGSCCECRGGIPCRNHTQGPPKA